MTAASGTSSSTGQARPLDGCVVIVTRPRADAEPLAAMLRARGATPVLAPAIELTPAEPGALADAAGELARGKFAWVVLTSRAGVEALFALLPLLDVPGKVAAVGAATASALRARGIEPDLVPDAYTTAALADAMPAGTGRVLLARADIAPGELEAAIAAKGWTPVRVDAYRTIPARTLPPEAVRALRDGTIDALTFTSASTVDGFMAALDRSGARPSAWPRVVCIGPVTAARARRAGLRVDAAASPHTIEGLVAAIEGVLGRGDQEGAFSR